MAPVLVAGGGGRWSLRLADKLLDWNWTVSRNRRDGGQNNSHPAISSTRRKMNNEQNPASTSKNFH